MIAADQPVCFPPELLIAVSSKDDGTMLNRIRGRHVAEVLENRHRFCDQIGITYDEVVYHVISYDQAQTFDNIAEVTEADTVKYNNEGIFADALYTEMAGVGLFLPVADCIATVIYDPKRRALMLAHLGRHSTVAQLMSRAVRYFVECGSQAKDLQIWMSPSITQKNYLMDFLIIQMIQIGAISAVKQPTEFIWTCKDLIVRWLSGRAFLVITSSSRQLIR